MKISLLSVLKFLVYCIILSGFWLDILLTGIQNRRQLCLKLMSVNTVTYVRYALLSGVCGIKSFADKMLGFVDGLSLIDVIEQIIYSLSSTFNI